MVVGLRRCGSAFFELKVECEGRWGEVSGGEELEVPGEKGYRARSARGRCGKRVPWN